LLHESRCNARYDTPPIVPILHNTAAGNWMRFAIRFILPAASQLKRWLLNRRRASVQRREAAAPVRRCTAPAERVDGTGTVYTPHPAPISWRNAHRFVCEPERQIV